MRISDATRYRATTSTLIVGMGVLGLAGCATGCSGGVSSSGACASPMVSVSPEIALPGDTVVITGEGFMECHDNLNGCEAAPAPAAQPPQPVTWRLGGEEDELARATPDDEGRIRIEVQVPADSAAGTVTVEVGFSEPATLTIQ